jgi:hypothetical protein
MQQSTLIYCILAIDRLGINTPQREHVRSLQPFFPTKMLNSVHLGNTAFEIVSIPIGEFAIRITLTVIPFTIDVAS